MTLPAMVFNEMAYEPSEDERTARERWDREWTEWMLQYTDQFRASARLVRNEDTMGWRCVGSFVHADGEVRRVCIPVEGGVTGSRAALQQALSDEWDVIARQAATESMQVARIA